MFYVLNAPKNNDNRKEQNMKSGLVHVQYHNREFIRVNGISMMPALLDGDKLILKAHREYKPGDVLVYSYGINKVLVHRLLFCIEDMYLCKGDNAFRTEQVNQEYIIGKVFLVIRRNRSFPPPAVTNEFLTMSYEVSREFQRNAEDISITISSDVYKKYIIKRSLLFKNSNS